MKIFIRTFGCTLNQSDSEVMSGFLADAGHKLVDSVDNADLVIFNTCTVKDSPEKRFFSEMRKVEEAGKKIVVAGCIPQAEPTDEQLKKYSLVGIKNINCIAEIVEQTAEGNVVRMLRTSDNPRLNLPKIRRNPVVEIIPLSIGCLGDCSYCKTRFARGKLLSYEVKAVKKQFEDAVKDGVKEIWLTSQDTGAYGKDIKSSLPELLNEILSVKGDYRVRLGMLNPNHALEFIDELIEILKHPNMFKFIHLPVQSGSDKILKDMNRKYKIRDFVEIVEKFRKEIPMITIATDIICGFPGETEEDFNKSYGLLKKLKIPVVNITKFFPRPGTPAKKMKQIYSKIIKKRSSALSVLQAEIIDNKQWIGWKGEIVIDETGKDNSCVGHNDFYKPVVIKDEKIAFGDVIMVEVKRVMQHYLEAEKV